MIFLVIRIMLRMRAQNSPAEVLAWLSSTSGECVPLFMEGAMCISGETL